MTAVMTCYYLSWNIFITHTVLQLQMDTEVVTINTNTVSLVEVYSKDQLVINLSCICCLLGSCLLDATGRSSEEKLV
jgi:hypothetical protein